ncbi:hypothetical protein UMZ34_14735 [Halopseudomonas pachastrellae]|nr:hypothetical protein UMZ34_14735 [Halopseudomonas pachastrellae]
MAIIASAVYTTRELTLAPDWFLLLSRANQAGAMLFAGTGTALSGITRCRWGASRSSA